MSDSPVQSPELLTNPTKKGLCPVAGHKQANRQLHLLPASLPSWLLGTHLLVGVVLDS